MVQAQKTLMEFCILMGSTWSTLYHNQDKFIVLNQVLWQHHYKILPCAQRFTFTQRILPRPTASPSWPLERYISVDINIPHVISDGQKCEKVKASQILSISSQSKKKLNTHCDCCYVRCTVGQLFFGHYMHESTEYIFLTIVTIANLNQALTWFTHMHESIVNCNMRK